MKKEEHDKIIQTLDNFWDFLQKYRMYSMNTANDFQHKGEMEKTRKYLDLQGKFEHAQYEVMELKRKLNEFEEDMVKLPPAKF